MQRVEQLKTELGYVKSNPNLASYPELKDTQRLMEFQTELEANENKFAVQLQDCREAKN